jgi:hypothetical protein
MMHLHPHPFQVAIYIAIGLQLLTTLFYTLFTLRHYSILDLLLQFIAVVFCLGVLYAVWVVTRTHGSNPDSALSLHFRLYLLAYLLHALCHVPYMWIFGLSYTVVPADVVIWDNGGG